MVDILIGVNRAPLEKRAVDIRLREFESILKNELVFCNFGKVLEDEHYVIKNFNRYFLFGDFILFLLRRRKDIDNIHLYNGHTPVVILVFLLSCLLNRKMIYHYVEHRGSFESKGAYHRINNYLIDKVLQKLPIKFIVISHGLRELVDSKDWFYLPPIFSRIKSSDSVVKNQFIYIDGGGYTHNLELVINQFNLYVENGGSAQLVIISSDKIINHNSNYIRFLSDVPYESLLEELRSSRLSIVVLNDTLKDKYRFPNKIGESLINNVPVLTQTIGDIYGLVGDKEGVLFCEQQSMHEMMLSLEDKEIIIDEEIIKIFENKTYYQDLNNWLLE